MKYYYKITYKDLANNDRVTTLYIRADNVYDAVYNTAPKQELVLSGFTQPIITQVSCVCNDTDEQLTLQEFPQYHDFVSNTPLLYNLPSSPRLKVEYMLFLQSRVDSAYGTDFDRYFDNCIKKMWSTCRTLME